MLPPWGTDPRTLGTTILTSLLFVFVIRCTTAAAEFPRGPYPFGHYIANIKTPEEHQESHGTAQRTELRQPCFSGSDRTDAVQIGNPALSASFY